MFTKLCLTALLATLFVSAAPTPSDSPGLRFGTTPNPIYVTAVKLENGGAVKTVYQNVKGPSRRWEFTSGQQGLVKVAGADFCLDAGENPKNGDRLKVWQCYDGAPQQTWIVNANECGLGTIELTGAGLCVDVQDGNPIPRTHNGTLDRGGLQLWQCTSGPNQQFGVEQVDPEW